MVVSERVSNGFFLEIENMINRLVRADRFMPVVPNLLIE